MTTEPQPHSEEPIDIGDLSQGGGGDPRPFGGLKFRGPRPWADSLPKNPDQQPQVTVVRTAQGTGEGTWEGGNYTNASQTNPDIASFMVLVPEDPNDPNSMMVFALDATNSNKTTNNELMCNDEAVTGLVIYPGGSGSFPVTGDHTPDYSSSSCPKPFCWFDGKGWPPAPEGIKQAVCSGTGDEQNPHWQLDIIQPSGTPSQQSPS